MTNSKLSWSESTCYFKYSNYNTELCLHVLYYSFSPDDSKSNVVKYEPLHELCF